MIIHEFGHFIVAKKFGARIDEFGIGYPPRLFGKKFGETLYSINLIPLGAFVKIYGEEGPEAEGRESFSRSENSRPSDASSAVSPVSGADEYRSFSNLSILKRILIVLGGVISFWISAIIIFAIVFMIGVSVPVGDQDIQGVNNTMVKILSVNSGSPAETAGLKSGDVLLKAQNGSEVIDINKVKDFQSFVKSYGSEQIEISINRDGKILNILVRPRAEYPENQGPTGVVLQRIGNVIEKYPWYQAIGQGFIFTGKTTWQAITGIYNVLASLFQGKGVPQGAELAGPVGITIFLSQAASLGAGFFLYFIGSLSVLLALFNIFPIPALDGGKLLFLVIEAIKRKPVSVKIEQTLTIIFFVLLITMSIFVTIRFDIPRVVDFWKAGL